MREGLDKIVHRAHLKAFQRVIGGCGGEDQQAVGVKRAQRPGGINAVCARHVDIQKGSGKTLLFGCLDKGFAICIFADIRLDAAAVQCLFQAIPQ